MQIRDKNHKQIHIGYFDLKLEASKARYAAEIKYGYTSCQMESTALNYTNKKGRIKNGKITTAL